MPAQVTIITPTTLNPTRLNYLEELHQNLKTINTTTPIKWVIIINRNDNTQTPPTLNSDFITKIYLTQNYGAATARNIGLANTTTKYVTTCDDDDLLPLNSITNRLHTLQNNPNITWVGGLLADLQPNGKLNTWNHPAQPGHTPKGKIWETWGNPANTFPLGPTTILTTKQSLQKIGGWQALPQGEDLGMTIALTTQNNGHMLNQIVYHYRKHPHQMMNTPNFNHLEQQVREQAYERGRPE